MTQTPFVQQSTAERPAAPRMVIIQRNHPWRWIGYILLSVALAMFVHSVFTNERWQWDVVWQYLFDPLVLGGIRVPIELTFGAMLFGFCSAASWPGCSGVPCPKHRLRR
ncbi:hypothetical protein ACTMTI_56005 [Nonomuraea sp. H19]|uniref:hypothetical protein n=1 Tax=Nonomuraea sp. H19 TaxID=3452206 RepID=UPI003F8C680F